MKYFFLYLCGLFLAIFVTEYTNAETAECYSGGRIVYKGKVSEIVYSTENPNVLWFIDRDNNQVFIQGIDCFFKLDKPLVKEG